MIGTIFGTIAMFIVIVAVNFSRYEDKKSGRRWWEW